MTTSYKIGDVIKLDGQTYVIIDNQTEDENILISPHTFNTRVVQDRAIHKSEYIKTIDISTFIALRDEGL